MEGSAVAVRRFGEDVVWKRCAPAPARSAWPPSLVSPYGLELRVRTVWLHVERLGRFMTTMGRTRVRLRPQSAPGHTGHHVPSSMRWSRTLYQGNLCGWERGSKSRTCALANAWNGPLALTEVRGTGLLEATYTSRTNGLSSYPIASTPVSAAKPGRAGDKRSRTWQLNPEGFIPSRELCGGGCGSSLRVGSSSLSCLASMTRCSDSGVRFSPRSEQPHAELPLGAAQLDGLRRECRRRSVFSDKERRPLAKAVVVRVGSRLQPYGVRRAPAEEVGRSLPVWCATMTNTAERMKGANGQETDPHHHHRAKCSGR